VACSLIENLQKLDIETAWRTSASAGQPRAWAGERAGLGPNFGRPGQAVSSQPTQACSIEMSKSHNMLLIVFSMRKA